MPVRRFSRTQPTEYMSAAGVRTSEPSLCRSISGAAKPCVVKNEPVGYHVRPPVLECPCTAEVDQREDALTRREGALNENIACLNIQMQKSGIMYFSHRIQKLLHNRECLPQREHPPVFHIDESALPFKGERIHDCKDVFDRPPRLAWQNTLCTLGGLLYRQSMHRGFIETFGYRLFAELHGLAQAQIVRTA